MAFNQAVFSWARQSAGLELDDAARALAIVPASLEAIERGKKEPSRATLAKMARVYHRSLLTFYLPHPPRKGDRGEDFRMVVGERAVEAEADLDALVRDLRARQSLVRAALEEDEDTRPVSFVGASKISDGVPALVSTIESLLGVTRAELRTQADAGSGFALLRERAERAGVFVLLVGNLGSYHSNIPVEAFRGFAIADAVAPFIVINDGDAKAAWSFTLVHELAHLCLGTTGVSGGGVPERGVERFCNDVAGEFLLPRQDVRNISLEGLDLEERLDLIAVHARRWRVSRSMVAYGLFKAGVISAATWKELDAGIRERWLAERRREKDRQKPGSGPSYYVIRQHRLGSALLGFVRRQMDAGNLSPSKAARVLGVKARSVFPLLATGA